MPFINKAKSFLLGVDGRSKKTNKNVLFSLVIKLTSIVCQLALVPLTLNYLDKTQYGIWITLSSILNWLSIFDIGIGNGLRNKLAVSVADGEIDLARTYVSTAYAFVTFVFTFVIILFFIINPSINWYKFLNAPIQLNNDLQYIALFVVLFFCLQFILNLISSVLFAHQKSAISSLINPIGNFLSLITIYIITKVTNGSLVYIAFTFSVMPVLTLLGFNIFLFSIKFRKISPSINFINIKFIRDLGGLGIKFFIIQISTLVLFTITTILISQFYGPDDVVVYNIAYRYFSLIPMVYGIVITPYWSAITEAYAKHDISWIILTLKKLDKIGYVLIFVTVLMFLIAPQFYSLWTNKSVEVPIEINLSLMLYIINIVLAMPSVAFVNATSKIRLQLFLSIFNLTFTIPLAFLFSKTFGFGPSGIILATVISSLPSTILIKIQSKKIIRGNSNGIWIE